MKKIFPILLLSMILGVFSSCIIIPPDRYTFNFYNDTPSDIYDWFLKDRYDTNYTLSSTWCPVPAGHYSSMTDLYEKDYQVYFCIFTTGTKEVYSYSENFFHVDKDCTYYLSSDSCFSGSPRSAILSDNETVEPNYVLIDSNGNKYPLKTVIIEKNKQ